MKTKLKIILLVIPICFLNGVWSQNTNSKVVKQNKENTLDNQAEKDWIEVDTMKTHLFPSKAVYNWYLDASFLEQKQYDDKIERKRTYLAETFLDNYPESPHYFNVLKFYFHPFFEPKFIPSKIPDSLSAFLSKESQLSRTHRELYLKQLRALPIDYDARNQWLEKGNELAENFLKSNAALEQKAQIETRLLGRDLRIALYQYEYLNLKKAPMEADYWQRFDTYYWNPLLLRVKELLYKYPNLELMASTVRQFITIVTMTHISPELKLPYWHYFLKVSESNNANANLKGIKAVNKLVKENLIAIESLKILDEDKPLEMAFTAIDGTKINLEDFRGKVVLLDFWSVKCAPCIKEMPHLKALYTKYRNQGFDVIGLAADSDLLKPRVLEIIEQQGAIWPQRLDKGSNVQVSYHDLYNITALPTVWLLDKEGKIVDKNARGLRLEPLIRTYLNLD